MDTPAPSLKWTVAVPHGARKRIISPPTSDDNNEWTLDQLKLECTARKLNVAKNTRKNERVSLLQAWDTNKVGVQVLLSRQRKRSKETNRFFDSFMATGHQLSHDELDDDGSTFWIDVATAFGSDTAEYDALISDDANFEDVDASMHMTHSGAKIKRSKFARAEAESKVSGQGSNDFWDFCDGRADVFYLDRWCKHRQAGREFCAANVYAADEDDSTQEGFMQHNEKSNRKGQKTSQADAMASLVDKIEEAFGGEANELQEDTWREHFIQEQRAAQKLFILSQMLTRNAEVTQELMVKRHEVHVAGLDAAEIGRALRMCQEKKAGLKAQIKQLELEIMNGFH